MSWAERRYDFVHDAPVRVYDVNVAFVKSHAGQAFRHTLCGSLKERRQHGLPGMSRALRLQQGEVLDLATIFRAVAVVQLLLFIQ